MSASDAYTVPMNKEYYDHQKLVRERQERKLTQSQVAQLAGVTLRTVQRIEAGQSASLDSLDRVARVYRKTLADIIYARPQRTEKILSPITT